MVASFLLLPALIDSQSLGVCQSAEQRGCLAAADLTGTHLFL